MRKATTRRAVIAGAASVGVAAILPVGPTIAAASAADHAVSRVIDEECLQMFRRLDPLRRRLFIQWMKDVIDAGGDVRSVPPPWPVPYPAAAEAAHA